MKKVKINDFEILATLGVGTFGRVRLVRHKNTSKYYAAKILKKMEILKSKQIDHVQSEAKILSTISHPFIVSHIISRSTWKDLPKMPGICTLSWNTLQVENS